MNHCTRGHNRAQDAWQLLESHPLVSLGATHRRWGEGRHQADPLWRNTSAVSSPESIFFVAIFDNLILKYCYRLSAPTLGQ